MGLVSKSPIIGSLTEKICDRNVPWPKCSLTEMYPDRNVLWPKCSVTEMYPDRNVPWPKCSVTEKFRDRNVLWPKCSLTEMYLDRNVLWPKCSVTEMFSDRKVPWPKCSLTEKIRDRNVLWPKSSDRNVPLPKCFWPKCETGVLSPCKGPVESFFQFYSKRAVIKSFVGLILLDSAYLKARQFEDHYPKVLHLLHFDYYLDCPWFLIFYALKEHSATKTKAKEKKEN